MLAMMGEKKYEILVLEEAHKFLESLPKNARRKIQFDIRKVLMGFVSAELFKKLEGTDIWEFRTLYEGITYRTFAFWDKTTNALIVATHGIVKKTQKTPVKEIKKAESIMKQYYQTKK